MTPDQLPTPQPGQRTPTRWHHRVAIEVSPSRLLREDRVEIESSLIDALDACGWRYEGAERLPFHEGVAETGRSWRLAVARDAIQHPSLEAGALAACLEPLEMRLLVHEYNVDPHHALLAYRCSEAAWLRHSMKAGVWYRAMNATAGPRVSGRAKLHGVRAGVTVDDL